MDAGGAKQGLCTSNCNCNMWKLNRYTWGQNYFQYSERGRE